MPDTHNPHTAFACSVRDYGFVIGYDKIIRAQIEFINVAPELQKIVFMQRFPDIDSAFGRYECESFAPLKFADITAAFFAFASAELPRYIELGICGERSRHCTRTRDMPITGALNTVEYFHKEISAGKSKDKFR